MTKEEFLASPAVAITFANKAFPSFAWIAPKILSIQCTSLFITGIHPLSIYFLLTMPTALPDFHPIPKMLLDLFF